MQLDLTLKVYLWMLCVFLFSFTKFMLSAVFRVFLVCSLLLSVGCATIPKQEKVVTMSLSESELAHSKLYQAVQILSSEHGGASAVYPIQDALEAYSSRVLLVRSAEKTLDVQYYIWRRDNTGLLLLYELYLAAERGVRVRLLLDDLGSFGLDDWLVMLNDHPNIEVRLFNPFSSRKSRLLGFVTNFKRANRRMHNKSITADQSMSIVGGRNIGDEYFAATEGVLFADLDVLTLGPAALQVSHDFDLYWNSQSAFPAKEVVKQTALKSKLLKDLSAVFDHPDSLKYIIALQNALFTQQFVNQDLPFEWTTMRLVSDNPAKGVNKAKESDLLLYKLVPLLGESVEQFDLVSPYFVPTRRGARYFKELARQGVKVRVLTNALEATDVALVHSGYMRRRKKLLKAGIELYEMKNDIGMETDDEREKQRIFGSSGSSLHAKTFAVNNQKLFVGSFNFDPRSARLNTELGFVIDSPTLAAELHNIFDQRLVGVSYRLFLTDKKRLRWEDQKSEQVFKHEPNTSMLKRFLIRGMSWLPLEPFL